MMPLRFATIVSSFLLFGVTGVLILNAAIPEENEGKGPKTPDQAVAGSGDVRGRGEEEKTAASPRPKVEVRKSSNSSRAKGDINFDDLAFGEGA